MMNTDEPQGMILVMSGTRDGKEIVRLLHSRGIDVITTVATGYGKQMFERMGLGHICLQRRLDTDSFLEFIQEHRIETVIDATHPYAAQASINAITACRKGRVNYIRFEREGAAIPDSPLIHRFTDIDEAVTASNTLGSKILLTTGFTSISKFHGSRDRGKGIKDLVVRILPVPEHINKCLEIGIPPSNIIAAEGPFSTADNIKTIREHNIDLLVTKDSGATGGTPEKIEAALTERINVALIIRPQIHYPITHSSTEPLLRHLGICNK